MRWLLAVCLLAACAGGPRSPAPEQRVEVRGDAWSISYRLVLDEPAGPRLEGRAEVTNTTAEDWTEATLTLATVSDTNDRDRDGIRDIADLCPGDPEDADGIRDDDGCPDPDNDADRILDDTDRCPNEPETYNGQDDEDGCPDRETVQINHDGGGLIEWIYFTPGSDVVKPVSLPIIDAVAATILGNPQFLVIEISGHTDGTERDPWSLSLRRAAAVRQRLVDKGVAGARLMLGPYAALQPNATGTTAADLARNRRAGFVVVQRDDADTAPLPVKAVRPPFDPRPAEVVDALEYELAQPVTARRRETVTIAILDKPVTAREIRMWQPDPEVEGSQVHAFETVRLVNTSGFVLQRGPIEIVVGDRVMRRAVLPRLGIGETAWIRGELDRTTRIVAEEGVSERPYRVVSGDRGELVVDDLRQHKVTYTFTAARAGPLELHHRRIPNHTTETMPSATTELADRLIVARDLAANVAAVIEIVEHQPHRVVRRIDRFAARELALYLAGSTLAPDITELLGACVRLLAAIEAQQQALALERAKLGGVVTRWQTSGRPLDRATRTELEAVGRAVGQATSALELATVQLDALVAKLPTW